MPAPDMMEYIARRINMPVPDMMVQLAKRSSTPPFGSEMTVKAAPKASTDALLRELIDEVKGLRRELRAEQLLPDTAETRRIRAEIDAQSS